MFEPGAMSIMASARLLDMLSKHRLPLNRNYRKKQNHHNTLRGLVHRAQMEKKDLGLTSAGIYMGHGRTGAHTMSYCANFTQPVSK